MREEDEQQSIYKDYRVILFALVMLASIFFIQPWYSADEGLTTNLKYGLDLEGGSWLQVKPQGAVAQLDADTSLLLKEIIRMNLGEEVNIRSVETANDQVTVVFASEAQLTSNQLERIGMGQVSVSRINGLTEVRLTTSKDRLISTYLEEALKTEVVPMSVPDGVQYEIRASISQQELQELMSAVDGQILPDNRGEPLYRDGVTPQTRDLTAEILREKLNTLGLRDIPVRTVGDDYIIIDFAGLDLATATEIAERPGRFEIRIVTQGNDTRHVLYGDEIRSVGIVGFNDNDGQWYVPFTLTDAGALALQQAAIETGATRNPSAHNLVMYLDDNEVYSAPLSHSAAARLQEIPIYSWQASTGPDEESKQRAEQLQIHLRAGALPVKVEIVGSGQVDATLGQQFRMQALVAGILSLFAVAFVIQRKYRKNNILFPMIATSLSEVLMILGFAAAIGWQLDLASVAAIIAVIGTGIDHLVIITDEVLYEGKLPPKKVYLARITKAFSIIMAAAATTIIAMSPLVFMGFGALQGFAITTIVGVLIGIFIARPVYARVIQEILEKERGSTAE